jgi:hypothetical protein
MGALCPGSTWAKPLYSKRASYPTGRAVRPPTAARSRPRPAGRVLDASTNRGASRWATRPRPARSSLSTRVRTWEQEVGRTLRMASPPRRALTTGVHLTHSAPPPTVCPRFQGKGGRSPFRSARPRRSACRCHQVGPALLSKSGLVVAPLLDGHAQMFGEEPCSARRVPPPSCKHPMDGKLAT